MPKSSFFVIPVKTGIQSFQYVLDTRLREYDEQTEFINRLQSEVGEAASRLHLFP